MQILEVLYKSGLDAGRVEELFRQRSSRYAEMDGLRQKFYLQDPSTGQFGGIYVFEDEEALSRFTNSGALQNIIDTYKVAEPPIVRQFEVPMSLGGGGELSDRETSVGLLHNLIDRGYNNGDLSVVDEVFALDYEDHQAGIAPPGGEGVRSFIRQARGAFPDLSLRVEETSWDNDRLGARTTARGTHDGTFMNIPATGRSFTVTRFDLYRFQDGRFVEHWGVIDRLDLLQQIGAVIGPEQSFH